jgi:hypothetical protein
MSCETRAAPARPKDIGWSLPPRGSQERQRLGWVAMFAGVAMMLAGGAVALLSGL